MRDLESAARRFEALGFAVVDGGRHERLAVARANPFGQALLDAIAGRDARRLGLAPEHRSRLRPDGVRVTWRAAGLDLALVESWLPFFVAWDDPALHPGQTSGCHRTEVSEITWVELATDAGEMGCDERSGV